MFEEFVAHHVQVGDWRLEFEQIPGNILLHGHCHQKAHVGTGPSKQTLALTGATVTEWISVLRDGGLFGYETNRSPGVPQDGGSGNYCPQYVNRRRVRWLSWHSLVAVRRLLTAPASAPSIRQKS